jgi:hypothetical protein
MTRFHLMLFLWGSVIVSGQNYTVSVYGFPIAQASLDLASRDTIRLSYQVTGLLSYFFPENNTYTTVYNGDDFTPRSFMKNIRQGLFKQKVTITYRDSIIAYEDQVRIQSAPRLTVFTLLAALTYQKPEALDTRWFNLDHEGQPYRARLLWANSSPVAINGDSVRCNHYRLDMEPETTQPSFYETTDTFMKYTGDEGTVKQIWVEESGKHRIIKAAMKVYGLPFQVLIRHE